MPPKKKRNYDPSENDESDELESVENGLGKRKQITKAKKFRKKPQDELNRIMKSREQKFYIIHAKRLQDEKKWIFLLRGQNYPKIYKTVFSTRLSCTCLDYRYRGKPCKHHFFFITRIILEEGLLDYFRSNNQLSENAYEILDAYLADSLHDKMKEPILNTENIDLKDENECVFCLCEMKKGEQKLQGCSNCKKYFHHDCISLWKVSNPSCPLCRESLAGDDPFSLVKSIEI